MPQWRKMTDPPQPNNGSNSPFGWSAFYWLRENEKNPELVYWDSTSGKFYPSDEAGDELRYEIRNIDRFTHWAEVNPPDFDGK